MGNYSCCSLRYVKRHLIAIGRLRLVLPIKANDSLRFKMNYGAGYSTPGMTEMYHHWLMASNAAKRAIRAFDIYLQR